MSYLNLKTLILYVFLHKQPAHFTENCNDRKTCNTTLPVGILPMLSLIVLKTRHQWICTIFWMAQVDHE